MTFPLAGRSPQLAHQRHDILGDPLAIEGQGLVREANHQIVSRQFCTAKTELLPDNAFDPVAVDRLFQQFLSNYQTQPGVTGILGTRLKMQHQPLPANCPPKTKNG